MENEIKPCGLDSMFVCYSTNSPTLYYDAGTVNDLYITRDPRIAMEYVRDQIITAYDNGFGVAEGYEEDFRLRRMVMDKPRNYAEFAKYIETFPYTLIVYRGGRDNSDDYYDIRVEKLPLLESFPNPYKSKVVW